MTPPSDGAPMFAGSVPLHDIVLPVGSSALGIPEVVLAAYRNAELALDSSMPGCGLPWSLLAGIGKIESGHASSGRTDAAGTTINPIFGPALDGTLPGNEIIKAADGGAVRAVGPMQFLPSTWSKYAADGNGDGISDPHNVFDASLAAGKYLCSGNLDLRDPAQELRAVLRYNNSMAYAANVLSWSAAYRTGGTPRQVSISPDLIPPGAAPIQAGPDMTTANTIAPTMTTELPPNTTTTTDPTTTDPTTPTQMMINIPGLPPIPCGIFCPRPAPKPADPCEPLAVPAIMPRPGEPVKPVSPGQTYGAGEEPNAPDQHPDEQQQSRPVECTQPHPGAEPAQQPGQQPAEQTPEPQAQTPSMTPEPGPDEAGEPAPPVAPAPTPAPGITLPFGIVIPLPPQ
ncbi:lytic transglycosylase domain-containing protein [Nocardia australiensis]|uniref:lytic transglycosylase domain-containing protein n=1 Tax=Nocardia australiensis TaxID=2887191 RepID=UPI001D14DC0B|nr:lytic murein transglycosylase [Nocardia australiensis]